MSEQPKVPSYLLGMGDKVDMEGEQRYSRGMFRFWLPKSKGPNDPEATANIIFLSDGNDVPLIWEHQVALYKKGKEDWNNYFTCLEPTLGSCPICDYAQEYDKFHRYKAQLFTIINLKGYFSKKHNKQIPFSRQILTAKKATSEILMRRYAARLDVNERLRGAQFKVTRGSDPKGASVGTDFEFVKMVDLGKFQPDDIKVMELSSLEPNRDIIIKVIQGLRKGPTFDFTPPAGASGGEPTDDVVTQVDYGDPEVVTPPTT